MRTQGEGEVDRLVRERFFADAGHGVFVDVGAASPDFLSMSALYRDLGWRVIAIEPNPAFCEAHRAAGHEVLQYACSDRDEDAVDFEVVDSHGEAYEEGAVSYESFSALAVKPEFRAMRADLDVTKIKVDVRRLDTILAEHAPDVERIDVVSVDVEGWELEVLDGLTFDRYRPAVLIVENLLGDSGYAKALRDRGYVLWRRRAPNDVYVIASKLSAGERAVAELRGRSFGARKWIATLRGGLAGLRRRRA
jgi:FkbM family methyltransferase